MEGYKYILIDNKIASALQKYVADQIELTPTLVFRKATNEKWPNYSELIIKKNLEFESYYQAASKGITIYCMFDNLIYVSQELKNLLEEKLLDLKGIEYKRGRPLMGG